MCRRCDYPNYRFLKYLARSEIENTSPYRIFYKIYLVAYFCVVDLQKTEKIFKRKNGIKFSMNWNFVFLKKN